MSKDYLNKVGLQRLWSKVKEKFVAKDGNKVLSDNNFTSEYKSKLDRISEKIDDFTIKYNSRYVVEVEADVVGIVNSCLNSELGTPAISVDSEALKAVKTHYEAGEECVLSIFDNTTYTTYEAVLRRYSYPAAHFYLFFSNYRCILEFESDIASDNASLSCSVIGVLSEPQTYV